MLVFLKASVLDCMIFEYLEWIIHMRSILTNCMHTAVPMSVGDDSNQSSITPISGPIVSIAKKTDSNALSTFAVFRMNLSQTTFDGHCWSSIVSTAAVIYINGFRKCAYLTPLTCGRGPACPENELLCANDSMRQKACNSQFNVVRNQINLQLYPLYNVNPPWYLLARSSVPQSQSCICKRHHLSLQALNSVPNWVFCWCPGKFPFRYGSIHCSLNCMVLIGHRLPP